jgi:hypothetical protein
MNGTDAPICQDEQQRRADVLAHPTLNGLDFVEVDAADHRLLRVHFLKPVPPANAANPADPNDAYGLRADLSRITIAGGVRVVGIRPTAVTRQADGHLDLTVSDGGDFSVYTLGLDAPALDPFLRRIDFSFMASCPTDFDCRTDPYCPPPALVEPRLDYQAKDYASFRRLLLDLLPRLNPNWVERNPSDLGIALVELLAYAGDHLSYFQDAVATEAYLDTVRQRISARRHARLVDYRVHDGRNAWTWVHFAVNTAATLPLGARVTTRIVAPLVGQSSAPGTVIDEASVAGGVIQRQTDDGLLTLREALRPDPALAAVVVFETTHDGAFDPRNNAIRVHTWGNEECCLAPGTREAFLYSVLPGTSTVVRPVLRKDDYLLLEEVLGPVTGRPADADPAHRQVVRIEEAPSPTEDPVYTDTLLADDLQRRTGAQPPLPLLRVRWRQEDALAFPLCLSARPPGRELLRSVSLARGNLVLADHGTTSSERLDLTTPVVGDVPFRLRLARGPLTMQREPDTVDYNPLTGRILTPRTDLRGDARAARPAAALLVSFPTGRELWTPVPDLLDSPPFEQDFVAEVDNDGRALIRFGDGEYGREAAGAIAFEAVYRTGNGTAGNVGAESIAHVLVTGPAPWVDAVRNPLPATGGQAAETIEEVRRYAPQAFRAEQFRAVTEADYVAAARKLPDVAGAVATFRWTGSWYTVFVGIDPRDPADLVRQSKGLIQLSPRLVQRVRAHLTRFRLAGYDLEIRPPRFVPLEVDLEVCVAPDHFRGDVGRAVAAALSNRILPGGARGFFHSDEFTFGQPVYLSRLYAAIERVEGVDSVVIRTFRRYGQRDQGELQTGVLAIAPGEIAQLDNDPSFMENGVLRIVTLGGKA